MRTIKFRVYDKYNKCIDYDFSVGEFNTLNEEIENMEDDFRLMQFTGLLDKNGKEIFEGDWLVSAEDSSIGGSAVFYDYGQWQPFSYLGSYNGKEYEIVGNVHENPELLEKVVELGCATRSSDGTFVLKVKENK